MLTGQGQLTLISIMFIDSMPSAVLLLLAVLIQLAKLLLFTRSVAQILVSPLPQLLMW